MNGKDIPCIYMYIYMSKKVDSRQKEGQFDNTALNSGKDNNHKYKQVL